MTERGAARQLIEHAAPDRLVVARGLFTGPSAQVSDDLYARIVSGRAHRERYALHLEKGATVDTNTYFGRLPASYFQRWTTVDRRPAEAGVRHLEPGAAAAARIKHSRRCQDDREHGGRRHRYRRVVGPAQRVRRRRRAVDGMHRGGRSADDHRSRMDGARSTDDPARSDHHLHLQQGRRLRNQRRRGRGGQGPAGRHRRDLRRRPGHRRRRDPTAVQRRRLAARRQTGIPAAAEPGWRRRVFARDVRNFEHRRSRERHPDGRRHPLRTRDDSAAQRLCEPHAVADDHRRANALPEEHPADCTSAPNRHRWSGCGRAGGRPTLCTTPT